MPQDGAKALFLLTRLEPVPHTEQLKTPKSPGGLSREEQRVGLKRHGAVRGRRRFGQDQVDQHLEGTVAGHGIAAGKQAGGEAQEGGEEELESARARALLQKS